MTTRRERARELVKQFGYRSDCDLSLADIQWLGHNVESALADAERVVWEQAAQHAMTDSSGMLHGEECWRVAAYFRQRAQAGEEA